MTTGAGGSFVHGPQDNTLALTRNEDGTFTIAPAATEGVAYYEVSVGLYTTLIAGGTNRVYVTERVSADGESLVSTLKYFSFVDETWVKANTGAEESELADNVVYTLNGTSYYYIGDDSLGSTLNGTPKAPGMVSVSAYDTNGTLLASAQLTQ